MQTVEPVLAENPLLPPAGAVRAGQDPDRAVSYRPVRPDHTRQIHSAGHVPEPSVERPEGDERE